jgi:hypothetical protein
MNLLEPNGGAATQLKEDLLINLRAVSSSTGIPIHWMAWPELMSNRATAENMMEMIAAATRKERLIYEEAFTEMIRRSMDMAIDQGYEKNNIIGDFEVKLPLISVTMVKALSETWLPLQQNDVISMATLRNKVAGIDPMYEDKQIKIEKQENADSEPLNNNTTIQNRLKELQNGEDTDNENSKRQTGVS